MQTEMREKKPSFSNSHLFLTYYFQNIIWLFGLIIIAFEHQQLLLRIEIARDIIITVPWYKGFLIDFVPFLMIECVLHWVTLKHFYPNLRRGNIIWVAIMPFMILIGYTIIMAELFARAVESGVLS